MQRTRSVSQLGMALVRGGTHMIRANSTTMDFRTALCRAPVVLVLVLALMAQNSPFLFGSTDSSALEASLKKIDAVTAGGGLIRWLAIVGKKAGRASRGAFEVLEMEAAVGWGAERCCA